MFIFFSQVVSFVARQSNHLKQEQLFKTRTGSMKIRSFLQIDSHDNLIVALQSLKQGTVLEVGKQMVELQQDIPAKHKFALEDLDTGATAVMYGVIVGRANQPIRSGELITTANLDHATSEFKENQEPFKWQAP
ncbi:MAG: UxaA family hydrolase, partial [Desulforhopalus sp.]